MKKIAIAGLVMLAGFLSCKKNETGNGNVPPPVTGNVLSSNVFLVDTIAIGGVTDLTINLLKNNTDLRPKAGDILLAAPAVVNPFGFLRKVTSVSENGNVIICNTEQSNLNDAFAQLNFSMTYLDTFSSNASIDAMQTGSRLGIKFENNNTLANGINLNGEIFFNIPSVEIEYSKKAGTANPQKVLIQAELNTDGSHLEITNNNDLTIEAGEKVLTEFNLPVIKVAIPVTTLDGTITIPILFYQKLVIKALPISISGKAKWVTIPECSTILRVKFENSTWTDLSSYTINASSDSLRKEDFASSLSLSANATIFTPQFEIYPYHEESLRSIFAIPNSTDLTVQGGSPNFLLNYKLDVKGSINQAFYTGLKQAYDIPGNVINKTIKEGDWPQDSTFTDSRDGQVYTFKHLGTQVWMTQNLNYVSSNASWCYDCSTYGRLYDWNTANTVAPTGWHLPSDAEWTTLINFLGGSQEAGGAMKSTTLWNNPNTGATNSSGFSGFPGGYFHTSGMYFGVGDFGYWWSSTVATERPGYAHDMGLSYNTSGAGIAYLQQQFGLSVRCVRDLQ